MANTKISGLSAGAAVSATDVFPNVQSTGAGPVKTTAAQIKTFTNVPAGSDTQVQFNDGGAFGGDAGLVFNKTTNDLTATGTITGGFFSSTATNSEVTTNYYSSGLHLNGSSAGINFGPTVSSATVDAIISRSAAGVVKVTGASSAGAAIQLTGYTFATLPTGAAGMIVYITDGSAAYTVGDTISAGGSTNKVYAYYDGSNWKALTASF